MTNLLFRLFIKDYENVSSEQVRESYGVLGSIMGICLNVLLSIIKMCAGAISFSIAVFADAFNNLSDALSSIITLIGFKMSSKPADKQHPYGHGRIEYISALFVAIIILYMGIELVRTSFDKIFNAEPIIYTPISVLILSISIIVKLWMFFFNHKIGTKISSQSIIASAKDSLSDSVATLAVLISIIVFKFTGLSLDGYIGIVVAGFILFCGYQTIRDALSPLLGQPPSRELVDEIHKIVLAHEGIIGIHDLIIHNYGPTRFMLSLHAEVSASDDVIVLHDTIDLLEKELSSRFKCDAVIHMDPIETDNKIINQTREKVKEIVLNIDDKLTIHDFRMVSGPTHTNLIFDVVVPFDFDMDDNTLTERIQEKVSEWYCDYFTVINIDKN